MIIRMQAISLGIFLVYWHNIFPYHALLYKSNKMLGCYEMGKMDTKVDTIKIYLLLSSTSGILYAKKTIIVMLTIRTVAIHPLSCLL